MSGNGTHNNIYTAADIQNYLAGKLTPLQMNAMEKAALDDPFLAEAIEGYAGMQNDDWKQTLAYVKQSFAQTGNSAKVIPLKKKNNWWKAAAAVLIIGSTATLSYFLVTKNSQQEIAKNTAAEKRTTAADATITDNNSENVATDTASTGNLIIADNKLKQADDNYSKETPTIIKDVTRGQLRQTADSNFVYKPAPSEAAAPAKTADFAKASETEQLEEKAAAPATANAAPQQNGYNNRNLNNAQEGLAKQQRSQTDYYKKERKDDAGVTARNEPPLNNLFAAQVFSYDNTPLSFANVSVKSEDFGTYADVRGNFRLLSNDSLLTVEVKAAGFKPQTVQLRSNVQQNRIILTEDNSAFTDKTVVTTGGAVKSKALRRTALIKDSAMNAEPADGWDNYNRYVDNNIDIPDDILKNNIHGQVEISFEVKSNGAITNIKVDKSLCSNCDEAAIKLLQQGPQWKVKKGKKAKGRITVQF